MDFEILPFRGVSITAAAAVDVWVKTAAAYRSFIKLNARENLMHSIL